jgi:hypothetical protein
MDAARWYLNLKVRAEIGRAEQGEEWTAALLHLIRHSQPLLVKRANRFRSIFLDAMELCDLDRLEAPDRLADLLEGKPPRPRVWSMTVAELYHFEERLPPDLRAYARRAGGLPGGIGIRAGGQTSDGTLDALLDEQYVSRFVRVDLSATDSTLVEDFRAWLGKEREKLAAVGGPQPYRQALDELRGRRGPKLRTFAKIGVLPLIDLNQWRAETGARLTDAFTAELLGLEPDRLREARRYAALLSDPWVVEAWLGPKARPVRKAAPRAA